MSPRRAATVAAALFLALSCAGAPLPPEAPAVPVNSAAVVPPPKPPELSAVPDPPALVVSGRISKPSTTLALVREWSKLPEPQSAEVTEFVLGEAMGPLVDLDQPIDFAVAIAGSGAAIHDRTAVSVALKDVDRAKAAFQERYKLIPGDNGVLFVQGLGRSGHHDGDEAEDDRGEEHRACEIAPAYGPTPVRLVCGWGSRALVELAPWLTRTATRAETTSDLHAQLRMQPLRATLSAAKRFIATVLASTLGSRLGLSSARDLIVSAGGDVVDFALDLETASVDVKLGDPATTATAALRLSGRTSSLARLATAHPERSAPPPAAFWQLPGDADLAFFERGVDDAEFGRGRDLLLRLASDVLADGGLKDADRKAILEPLGKLATGSPLAYASGVDADAAEKAMAAERTHRDASDASALEEAQRVSTEALLGWRVMELEEPSAHFMGAVKDLASAWGRPAVTAAFRSKGRPVPVFRALPLPKGVNLPPGAMHYVVEYPFGEPRAAAKPSVAASPGKPIAVHLYIAPDGGRTWVGLGAGEVPLASKLASAIGASPDSLAARPEIAPLKTATVGAAGFLTLHAIPESALLFAGTFGGPSTREGFDELALLPHRGSVPMWFSWTAPSEAATAQVVATLEIPRGAMDDIVTTIVRHAF
jgi:hypothetical protein